MTSESIIIVSTPEYEITLAFGVYYVRLASKPLVKQPFLDRDSADVFAQRMGRIDRLTGGRMDE